MEANLSLSSSATLCLWLAHVSYWHLYVRRLFFVKWIYLITLQASPWSSFSNRDLVALWKVIKNDIFELLSSQKTKVCVFRTRRYYNIWQYSILDPGGKGGVAPFILTFISTFGTLGVKVALLKLMTMATDGDDTIKRLANPDQQSETNRLVQSGSLGCLLFLASVPCCFNLTKPSRSQVSIKI